MMENRAIFTTYLAVFLGLTIFSSHAQYIVGSEIAPPVPCSPEVSCTHPHLPAEARCQSSYCVCPDGNGGEKNCTMKVAPGRAVLQNPVLTQTCKGNQDCNFEHGVCNTTRSQCACNEGYTMSRKGSECLPIATHIGFNCTESIQCTANFTNSACIQQSCVCITGYHFMDNVCSKSSGLHAKCSNDQECSGVELAICDRETSTCICNENSVVNINSEKCLNVTTEMMGPCEDDMQCRKNFANSVCIDLKCQCTSYNHFMNSSSRCVRSRDLDQSCVEDHECYQEGASEGTEPQRCVDSVCVCNEKFIRNGNKCESSGASSVVSGILSVLLAILLFSRS